MDNLAICSYGIQFQCLFHYYIFQYELSLCRDKRMCNKDILLSFR